MSSRLWNESLTLSLVSAALVATSCGKSENKGSEASNKSSPAAEKKDDHSGWWCDEHGVPEEVCGQCNAKVAAEFKKKGDWCKEHDRPDSQCFIHHPELKDKFAARYRAKYGKEPPPRRRRTTSPRSKTKRDKGAQGR